MKFFIREGDNRFIYRRAKQAFNTANPSRFGSAEKYWDEFGTANNMKVRIIEWKGPYPVVEALDFNTEADYVWFLLRYS